MKCFFFCFVLLFVIVQLLHSRGLVRENYVVMIKIKILNNVYSFFFNSKYLVLG